MSSITSYTAIRKNLKKSFDEACENETPILVTRRNGGAVVITSQKYFSSLEETAYLLQSPKNAQRLLEALKRNKKDRVTFPDVKDLENELGI